MKTKLQLNIEDDRSIAGEISRALAARIVAGEIAPGLPLRQDHIAAEFRASHVPVREAFRRLEAQGLIVSEPRRGVRVAPLDAAIVLEVTEMRAALEELALHRAFPRYTEEDMASFAQILAAEASSIDVAQWEKENRRFHRSLAAPCGMPRLIASLDELHQASARFLFATWKRFDWQPRSKQEHLDILAAIESGDPERAATALKSHILEAGQALAQAISL